MTLANVLDNLYCLSIKSIAMTVVMCFTLSTTAGCDSAQSESSQQWRLRFGSDKVDRGLGGVQVDEVNLIVLGSSDGVIRRTDGTNAFPLFLRITLDGHLQDTLVVRHFGYGRAVDSPEGTILAGLQGIYRFDGEQWTGSALGTNLVRGIATHRSWGIVVADNEGLYRSQDDGRTWQKLPSPIRPFFLASTSDGVLIAASRSGGVYLSSDGGLSFAASALEDQQLNAVAGAGRWAVAGTASGHVFMLDPAVGEWIDAGEVGSGVRGLRMDEEGRLVVVTWAGVYRSSTSVSLARDDPHPDFPNRTTLSLHPNPAVDAVAIRFPVGASGRVHVSAYDLLARRVALVLDEFLPAGTHSVRWEVQGMPAGTYLVRIETPDGRAVRPVAVVR